MGRDGHDPKLVRVLWALVLADVAYQLAWWLL